MSNTHKTTMNRLKTFYELFANGHKLPIAILIVGAIISGFLEITGLLFLYYLLKILINSKSLDNHPIIIFLENIGIEQTISKIQVLGFFIVLVFVFKNLYILLYYHFQHLVLKSWKNKLSSRLMEGYLNAPYTMLLEYNSATIFRNINSIVTSALNGYILSTINLVSNIIVGVLLLSIMLYKYFFVTAIVGTLLVVSTYFQNFFLKRASIRLGKERDSLATDEAKQVFQGFSAIKETKVGAKEDFFLQAFEKVNKQSVNNESKILFLSRLPAHLTEIVVIFSIVILCAYILSTNTGNSSESISILGVLAAISFRISPIMNRTLTALQGMNKSISSIDTLHREIKKLRAATYKYEKVYEQRFIPFYKEIVLNKVSYNYPNAEKPSLADFSMTIKKGEFIGIVGRSGAGKTTLIDILLGLIFPTQGELTVDGLKINSKINRGWQKNIGYVPQDTHINEDSIANNVAYGISKEEINYSKVEEALKLVQLWPKIQSLTGGIHYDVGESGKFFSGGEKQRISIARAIYRGADVLVLDEATSSLDTTTESAITKAISHLKGEKTLLVIAHRLSTLKLADKIAYLDEGHLRGFDTFTNLYNSIDSFKEMVDLSDISDQIAEPTSRDNTALNKPGKTIL